MIARLLPGAGVDRPRILVLTAGHVGSDVFQGAVPAMVPFFVSDRGWSYAQAGVLVLIGSLGSSLLQPLAGIVGDRVRAPWLIPLGLVLASLGLLAAALTKDYALVAAALAVGGLGVALFHPEAVRAAVDAAGPSPGAALGFFATGGNAGFALGPALVAPLALVFGLSGAAVVALLPLAAAGLLLTSDRRARRAGTTPRAGPGRRRHRRLDRCSRSRPAPPSRAPASCSASWPTCRRGSATTSTPASPSAAPRSPRCS